MVGDICLIKIENGRTVPALCLKEDVDSVNMAQIRTADEIDIFNTKTREQMERYNKNKSERDQIKIREKYEINTVYIGKPEGLKSSSVVMVTKTYTVKQEQVVRKIAQVSERIVQQCNDLIKQVDYIRRMQAELRMLKKKVQLAQLNNEKYQTYEARIEQLLKDIGYPQRNNRMKKPFLNYREVPTKGYLRVYKGGRC